MALICSLGVAGVLICSLDGLGVAMWFGWLPGRCYVVWVVAGPLLCGVGVAMWFGCC